VPVTTPKRKKRKTRKTRKTVAVLLVEVEIQKLLNVPFVRQARASHIHQRDFD